jgi:hypothetical protein
MLWPSWGLQCIYIFRRHNQRSAGVSIAQEFPVYFFGILRIAYLKRLNGRERTNRRNSILFLLDGKASPIVDLPRRTASPSSTRDASRPIFCRIRISPITKANHFICGKRNLSSHARFSSVELSPQKSSKWSACSPISGVVQKDVNRRSIINSLFSTTITSI